MTYYWLHTYSTNPRQLFWINYSRVDSIKKYRSEANNASKHDNVIDIWWRHPNYPKKIDANTVFSLHNFYVNSSSKIFISFKFSFLIFCFIQEVFDVLIWGTFSLIKINKQKLSLFGKHLFSSEWSTKDKTT